MKPGEDLSGFNIFELISFCIALAIASYALEYGGWLLAKWIGALIR